MQPTKGLSRPALEQLAASTNGMTLTSTPAPKPGGRP